MSGLLLEYGMGRGGRLRRRGQRLGPTLKVVLLLLIFAAILFLAFEDSDGLTLHDALDTTQFHHETVIEILASNFVLVAVYPTKRLERIHVHLTAVALFVALTLISASLVNLPDNARFIPGAQGINGNSAALGGTVVNLSAPSQPIAGVTVNYTLQRNGANTNTTAIYVTNATGSYLVFVPIGTYFLQINRTGFKSERFTENVLPSRGAHVTVFMVPLRSTAPAQQSPIVNTNATNTPGPPMVALYNLSYVSQLGSVCLATSRYVSTNGTPIISCVIHLGPYSQFILYVGMALMAAGVAVRVGLDSYYAPASRGRRGPARGRAPIAVAVPPSRLAQVERRQAVLSRQIAANQRDIQNLRRGVP